jgi:NAD(P)-dependent dehydrogenase (short-subunit alcohol dehydrogenase family)
MTPDSVFSRRDALASISSAALAAVGVSAVADTQTPFAPRTGAADKSGRYADKVAIITGGTSGIGRATAEAFAREGASVVFCGRRKELGESVAKSIQDFGGVAMFMQADVSVESQVEAFVKAAAARFGRIDYCFNNAGIDRPNKPIHETPASEFEEVIRINLTGAFFTLKHVIAQMLAQSPRGGCIVNTSSVGGHRGYPNIIAYSASKAALLSMTRTAASECSDKNIRVTSISPGPIQTAMLDRAVKDWRLPNLDAFAAGAANKRLGTTEEIARAVLWLCSPEASYFAGADLLLDGGYLLK